MKLTKSTAIRLIISGIGVIIFSIGYADAGVVLAASAALIG